MYDIHPLTRNITTDQKIISSGKIPIKKNNNPTWLVDMKFINKMQTWENVLDYTRDQKQTLTLNINSISCYHDSCPDIKKVLSTETWMNQKKILSNSNNVWYTHKRTHAHTSNVQLNTNKHQQRNQTKSFPSPKDGGGGVGYLFWVGDRRLRDYTVWRLYKQVLYRSVCVHCRQYSILNPTYNTIISEGRLGDWD